MSDPSDLIDPEAPAAGGERIDTPAYAGAPEEIGAPDLAHPSAAETLDVEAPAPGAKRGEATPPPPSAGLGADVAHAGEEVEPLPRAAADLGGGPGASSALPEADVLDRGVEGLLALATDRPWREITLRDVAERAGVPFAALYARAPGKQPLLLRLSDRFDRQALAAVEGERQPEAHDRLFEAFMARLEVMASHRDVLIAIGRAEPAIVLARLPRTARALAEASGVDTAGTRGALRLTALAGAWARTLQVWRDDEGAYNRTMAEIDRRLRQAAERLARVGAGF